MTTWLTFAFFLFGYIVAPLAVVVVVVISLRGVFVAVLRSGNIKLPQNVCHSQALMLLPPLPHFTHHLVPLPAASISFIAIAFACLVLHLFFLFLCPLTCLRACVAKVEAFNELKFEACVLEQQQLLWKSALSRNCVNMWKCARVRTGCFMRF